MDAVGDDRADAARARLARRTGHARGALQHGRPRDTAPPPAARRGRDRRERSESKEAPDRPGHGRMRPRAGQSRTLRGGHVLAPVPRRGALDPDASGTPKHGDELLHPRRSLRCALPPEEIEVRREAHCRRWARAGAERSPMHSRMRLGRADSNPPPGRRLRGACPCASPRGRRIPPPRSPPSGLRRAPLPNAGHGVPL